MDYPELMQPRSALLFIVGCLSACAASPQEPAWPNALVSRGEGVGDRVVVEVEAPPPSSLLASTKPIDRTAIFDGEFVTHVSLNSQHGCSQSWASTTVSGSVKLVVRGGVASVALDLEQRSVMGSRMSAGPPTERSQNHKASWSGKVTAGERPGVFLAKLSLYGCEDQCVLPPVEVRCEKKQITIMADEPGTHGAQQPDSALDGMVCTGFEALQSGSLDLPKALPLSGGSGVDVSALGFHGPSDDLRVTRHREAP